MQRGQDGAAVTKKVAAANKRVASMKEIREIKMCRRHAHEMIRVLVSFAEKLSSPAATHRNDSMEVETVVEAGLREVDEIGCCARDAIEIYLCLELAHRGIEGCDGIRHGTDEADETEATESKRPRPAPCLRV